MPFIRTKRPAAVGLTLAALLFVAVTAAQEAEARAPRGGRSFSGSRTFSRPAPSQPSGSPTFNRPSTFARQPLGGGSFMRGLAGGMLGGMIGGMLFGRPAHGGMGGFGGSGIGLIEILLFGGLAWFLFRRFLRPPRSPGRSSGPSTDAPDPYDAPTAIYDQGGPMLDIPPAEGPAAGLTAVRRSDPRFDPDLFREGAQDVFFKVQAAWMRRDPALLAPLVGEDLLAAYRREMEDLRARGRVNRLENIAVRTVEIVDAGLDRGYAWVVVRFTANLLDYTVDEASGQVVEGDATAPVKFAERWTFAAPEGTSDWKLEGIEQ